MKHIAFLAVLAIVLCACGTRNGKPATTEPYEPTQPPPSIMESSSVTPGSSIHSIPPKVALSSTQCSLPTVTYNDNAGRKEVTCGNCPASGKKCVVYKHLSPFGISRLKMSPERGEAQPWIKCEETPVIYSDEYTYRCMCE